MIGGRSIVEPMVGGVGPLDAVYGTINNMWRMGSRSDFFRRSEHGNGGGLEARVEVGNG